MHRATGAVRPATFGGSAAAIDWRVGRRSRAGCCICRGGCERRASTFSRRWQSLPADAWTARLMCLSGLTQQALLRGELDVAQALQSRSAVPGAGAGSLLFEGLLELDHAQLLEQRGAPHRAESLLADMHELLLRQANRADAACWGGLPCGAGVWRCARARMQRGRRCFERLEDCLRSQDKRVLYGFLGLAQLAANQARLRPGVCPAARCRAADAATADSRHGLSRRAAASQQSFLVAARPCGTGRARR